MSSSPQHQVLDEWAQGAETVTIEWQENFLSYTANYDRECTPSESAECLRALCRSKLLRFTDMRDAPERFFAAHRLLASRILGGFGIRFTVQFNLFAGSVLGLGNERQVKMLEDLQEKGQLGCFALTEVGAGVLSGFIVKATATWDAAQCGFVISTPTAESEKNWISQGLTAEWVVVFADLIIDGSPKGPHPFLLRMRHEGTDQLVPGISLVDMGKKTVANDLDNARIRFTNVFAPRESLLSRFVDVTPEGKYIQLGSEAMRIEVIGQRLVTGRLAIAEAALVAVRQMFLKTKAYADSKPVNAVSGSMPLSQLPQLKTMFDEAHKQLTAIETFTASVEARLAWELRRNTIPNADLVEAISVCKVRNIELSITMQHRLEQEVGSFALMAESGFIYKDMLLCCKFAEGDSRILMQKMARDELKRAQKRGLLSMLREIVFQQDPVLRSKALKTFRLARALRAAPNIATGFEQQWEMVYGLANNMCDAHVHARPSGEEVSRILRQHPKLMPNLQQPLLVSRL
eukprot:gnl/MRDRNA2_/MRDRNA2_61735_c0_seq1.p1 gnl/MRDRNA2_/MRDRNA2_61735_c0~~gnl/MRDRNA2_/MRDRNA2_61735_c0_seq1.p1  ORF type:complete len:547 (+),score=104.90 gnl/MRDRNA2_/MRDRNA2_61735_c0_seq1:90-1643(+)